MCLKNTVIKRAEHLMYYQYDCSHRTIGPAEIWLDGDMFWCQYGALHRMDGPAQRYAGIESYFIRDVEYGELEYESKIHEH